MTSPRIEFMIGGVQKGGTTALSDYLGMHPAIRLPANKEAHVFDAPDFDDGWDVAAIDARFAPLLGDVRPGTRCGDATPITVFHPTLVARVARYNPRMRWIIPLRDPVDRAISHYFMERTRGAEPLGLLRAVLAESRRCRGHENNWSPASPLRTWTYAARGRYAAQLDVLFEHFPRDQVLLLRSRDLAATPAEVVAQVLAFLGLDPLPRGTVFQRVFEGGYRAPSRWAPGRMLLRWKLRGECAKLMSRYGIDLRSRQPGTASIPPRLHVPLGNSDAYGNRIHPSPAVPASAIRLDAHTARADARAMPANRAPVRASTPAVPEEVEE